MPLAPSSTVLETGQLRIEMKDLPENVLLIRPVGFINEDFDFGRVLDFVKALPMVPAKVSFDMSEVSQINSCGTREWLLFLQRAQASFRTEFALMGEAFMEAASIVGNMTGVVGTPILSVHVPFLCEKCKNRDPYTFNASDIVGADGKYVRPRRNCPICALPMEIDVLEDEYFGTLYRR